MITKTKNLSQTETADPQSWLLSTIQLYGLVTLTLHLAAFKLPKDVIWSVWPYTFLTPWLGWILALLCGALIIPSISNIIMERLNWLWLIWPYKRIEYQQRWFVLAALLAGLLFWLARLRHLRWGDGYYLTILLSHPDDSIKVVYNWQAPLTVFIHQRLWQFVAHPLLGWSVENVYAAVSIVCGVIFVYVLLTFLVQLGRSLLETAVLVGLILTTGSVQLFFGYVENYTIISVGLLITLFLAWQTLHKKIQLVWSVLVLSLTNGFHPSTVFLWPGILVLAWLCWRRGYTSFMSGLLQIVIPPLLIAGGILALMESGSHGISELLGKDRPGGGDGLWFVPLFETTTKWEHYTMFSVAHILDWSNEHFLLSPFGLPLIIIILISIQRFEITIFDKQEDKDYSYFLGTITVMYLLLSWFWNLDYGGQKDWDLFAPSAFIYTLLAGYLLVRVLSNQEKLSAAGLFMISISFLYTGAWIFTNTHNLPRE